MTELLTAAQMRAIEQAAIESGEVTGLELMERAGQGVVEAILEEWPELDKRGASPPRSPGYLGPDEGRARHAVVLCGPGNNGGDGFVVARLLQERDWEVEVFLYGDPEKLPPDARVNYERWLEVGKIANLTMPEPLREEVERADQSTMETGANPGPDIVIDALFGTGLARPITGLVELLTVCQIDDPVQERTSPYVVAVDVPSGLCADSGRVIGGKTSTCVGADLTVSFHRLKLGHELREGPSHCGLVRVVDIGLDDKAGSGRKVLAELHGVDIEKPGQLLPFKVYRVEKFGALHLSLGKTSSHKYDHGHALILSGGPGNTGAARLAARGALRIGAGLVTLGVPPSAQLEVAAQVTAIMLSRIDGTDQLAEVLEDERLNALCLGPGMGLDRARDLAPVTLRAGRSAVLDADALSAFADKPEDLFGMLHENCVLTPHGGEFARLFPDLANQLNATPVKGTAYSKVDATRDAAHRAGCVVLFKGPDTVIAAPDGRCSVNSAHYERSAPWLATAGSGDVLAGFVTGLLARGFAPMQAAETAAWLHVECARSFGPGLIAEDLAEQLPTVF